MPDSAFLRRRDKREAASDLKNVCIKDHSSELVRSVLDDIFQPNNDINNLDYLEWIRLLISGGLSFDEFVSEVRAYDNSNVCGLVWTAKYVAYRCRTCGISPCMSLCADCFVHGNHVGHDYNMFRSQAGGACDCGDENVMRREGFCHRHGQHRAPAPPAPSELLCVAQVMMPRMVVRLVQYLRALCRSVERGTFRVELVEHEHAFLDLMNELSRMGDPMRQLLNEVLVSADVYQQCLRGEEAGSPDADRAQQALRSLPSLRGERVRGVLPEECTNVVDELLVWTVKYEFPERLVTFLLNLLPCDAFKECFARSFVRFYGSMALSVSGSLSPEELANRVVHMSVQLFSNSTLACLLVTELPLLTVMAHSLLNMVEDAKRSCDLRVCAEVPPDNLNAVVDCGHQVMRKHCYWPVASDLINLLTHRDVALRFLQDRRLLLDWLDLVSAFQGMNTNTRQLDAHVEIEPDTYYAAFSAELECCASPMWSLLQHLRDESTAELTLSVVGALRDALLDWMISIGLRADGQTRSLSPLQCSFHLPLHRYLAMFVSNGLRRQGLSLDALFAWSEQDALQLVQAPLRIQASLYEIQANLWVRNGLQMKGQAMTYVQCHFCSSMLDADLFLLQLCAARLPPDVLVGQVLDAFHVREWLSPRGGACSPLVDEARASTLLEGALFLLVQLVTLKLHLGLSERDVARSEMVALLAVADRTHSQLVEHIPDRCSVIPPSVDYDQLVHEVARFQQPALAGDVLREGVYVPLDVLWQEHFDPVWVQLRAIRAREMQDALDRFSEWARRSRTHSKALWPPFRRTASVPDELRPLLACSSMHALVLCVLHKVVKGEATEMAAALAVFLLDTALSHAAEGHDDDATALDAVPEHELQRCFPSGRILPNLATHVRSLHVGDHVWPWGEGVIPLLVQLHARLGQPYSPTARMPSACRIGDGVFFIRQVLDHACALSRACRAAAQQAVERLSLETRPDADTRRRRARARQEKLLAQMAAQQRSFLQSNQTGSDAASAHDTPLPAQCVICGAGTDRTLAALALLQLSTVQCHRTPDALRRQMDAAAPPLFVDHVRTTREGLPAPMRVLAPQCTGVLAMSCGHRLHLDCAANYKSTTPRDHELVGVEFRCPLCRCLANALLPELAPTPSAEHADLSSPADDSPSLDDALADAVAVMTRMLLESGRSVGQARSDAMIAALDVTLRLGDPKRPVVPILIACFGHVLRLEHVLDCALPLLRGEDPAHALAVDPVRTALAAVVCRASLRQGRPLERVLRRASLLSAVQRQRPFENNLLSVDDDMLIRLGDQLGVHLEDSYPLDQDDRRCLAAWTQATSASPPQTVWGLPRLLQLPNSYDVIFQRFRLFPCNSCRRSNERQAVCLVCGDHFCIQSGCAESEARGNGAIHLIQCGGDTGVFLLVDSSEVMVFAGPRVCVWGSIYLDEFGEEDKNLKRGKPLFLCTPRYEALERHWRHGTLHTLQARWVLHGSRI